MKYLNGHCRNNGRVNISLKKVASQDDQCRPQPLSAQGEYIPDGFIQFGRGIGYRQVLYMLLNNILSFKKGIHSANKLRNFDLDWHGDCTICIKIESLTLTHLKKDYFMTFLKGCFSLLAACFLSAATLNGQGYHIEVELKGLSNDTVILGEYFTSRMVPKDTLVLDSKGHGIFEGQTLFKGGLYLVFVDAEHYFDFLLGDDQELLIKADTTDLAGSVSFSGSEDNQVFQEFDARRSRFRRVVKEPVPNVPITGCTIVHRWSVPPG